ncbi:MAG TPA: Uma2 family endonuclease [Alphaproteobacteria bacterium]|nr:Uma2 family endonuclease [Alphaproteobacteria bacterium]
MAQRTIVEPSPNAKPWDKVPPLHAGDRLSRFEFERRYAAHPEIKKAELIEGVVYMPSPIRYPDHAAPHFQLNTWLGLYCFATPGVQGADNATVRLDLENEVQPDALLRLEPELGGRSRVTEDHYLEGPPELVLEIAASSVAYDLHVKLRAYQRSGVEEYIAVQMYERRLDWFRLREGVYQPLQPDASGLLCSEVFPGLCLDPAAFWAGDMARVLAILQDKFASPEHAAFVASLQARRPSPTV